ncbi:hypothetical protein L6164_028669 [Bauhinia variegata]|uniref:Uncharacterized protein n=1 Tax=Bauhinia variegata TaxID=167791 RepID=A0ACB9L7A8_BAUVA|nr:hypothetical protein L6164_028669 [Bauhinia variegata]
MDQQQQKEMKQSQTGRPSLEGLPLQTSPYVHYTDLEDYKSQGYGTQGHLEPKPGRGPGAIEGPAISGADVSSQSQLQPQKP